MSYAVERLHMDLMVAITIEALSHKVPAVAIGEQVAGHHVNAAVLRHEVVHIFHGTKTQWVAKGFLVAAVFSDAVKLHQVMGKAFRHIHLARTDLAEIVVKGQHGFRPSTTSARAHRE